MATGNWSFRAAYRQTDTTPASVGAVVETVDRMLAGSFIDGNDDGQIEAGFSYVSPAITGTHSFDHTALPGAFGNVSLSAVKMWLVYNLPENTHDIDVGGGSATVAYLPEVVTLKPGQFIFGIAQQDGFPITPTTADLLNVDAGANTVSLLVIIAGIN